jgi:hypothetical protein
LSIPQKTTSEPPSDAFTNINSSRVAIETRNHLLKNRVQRTRQKSGEAHLTEIVFNPNQFSIDSQPATPPVTIVE